MGVQMNSIPVGQSGTVNSTTAAKGTSNGSAATDTFSALLSDQTTQESAAIVDLQASETDLSMSMMMQMLQTLVMPIQAAVDQEVTLSTQDSKLSELLLDAMNSNPALADELLQNPKVKKWFEDADDLLASLSNSPNLLTNGFLAIGQQPISESPSLKAQKTLLALSALSKQQPDNPILNYLNSELTNAVQPILPDILNGLSKASKLTGVPVVGSKDQTKSDGRIPSSKYIDNKEASQSDVESLADQLQTLLSRPEKFAVKHVPVAVLEQTTNVTETPAQPLVDLPIETSTTTSTVVTIGDLQKAQQVTVTVEKAPVSTLTAANFTEEMTTHVLKNMKITISEGFSEAKLSLFPKNLGHVDVKISMHEGQLFAQFAADTLAGKQMLESQLPQLRQALLTQGLQVEKLEVTQSQNMSSSMFQEQRQPQSFNQSQQRQPKNSSGVIDMDAVDFKEDIDQLAQLRKNTNGNSFDVIA
ncbi:flagellar hook-length control protein FliK [Paenibacillus qinlingensis]|uniref:Flagellar hook-length control protein FliK n=1 Tax=Paenibacillus qinlingensis TaxID=1837343 RepID=A0ABU1P0F5_9BACL|nr:flagellar hook-length control protein FliK [Paenibacillus qinlingensis]MDR6552816.1 flagellar hook-length control protein FliK [Paenibacillus qinlingensis]